MSAGAAVPTDDQPRGVAGLRPKGEAVRQVVRAAARLQNTLPMVRLNQPPLARRGAPSPVTSA
jgi:hypothetical protein